MERLHHFRLLALTGAMLSLSGSFTPVRAQDPDDLKRGVARISLMEGDVSVRRGDSGEWVAGVINAPLLTDDRIASGPNSRTEIQFDPPTSCGSAPIPNFASLSWSTTAIKWNLPAAS